MANLALVTESTTHAAATNTKTALENKGHTVTLVDDANVGTTDFSSYDALVACRVAEASATLATDLRALVDGGTPLVLGLVEQGRTTAATFVPTTASEMRLIGTVQLRTSVDGIDQLAVTDNTHLITDQWTTGPVTIYSGGNYAAALDTGATHVGTALADGEGEIVGQVTLIAVEKDTNDLDGSPIGARVVVCGYLYGGQTAYVSDGETLLHEMVTWATTLPILSADLTPATEANSTRPLGRTKRKALATVVETGGAQAPTARKSRTLAPAAEVDSVGSIVPVTAIRVAITTVTETDTAPALGKVDPIRVELATVTEVADAPTFTAQKRLTLTPATEASSIPGLGGSVFRYRLTVPSYQKIVQPSPGSPRRYTIDQAVSIVRINGTLRQFRSPSQTQLNAAGTEGVDWFIGGRIYDQIPYATAQELTAAGFTTERVA